MSGGEIFGHGWREDHARAGDDALDAAVRALSYGADQGKSEAPMSVVMAAMANSQALAAIAQAHYVAANVRTRPIRDVELAADQVNSTRWYAMHDHGYGVHGHSEVNINPGDDHDGVATMSWEEFQDAANVRTRPIRDVELPPKIVFSSEPEKSFTTGPYREGGCPVARFDHASPPYGPQCEWPTGHAGDHVFPA